MARDCNFCKKTDCSYVCPKCGLFYCSVDCYRHPTHLQCSEAFYKDLVLQHLASNPDSKLKEKTLQLLAKLNLEGNQPLDEAFDDTLEDELSHEPGNLPLEERDKFERLIETGGIFNLLPAQFWDPWYLKFSQRLVTEIAKDDETREDDDEDADDEDVPHYPLNLPSLREITNKEPSPLMRCAVIQTIFAYCFICRYFTGDHHSDHEEAYDYLVKISSLDSPKVSFPETGQCLQMSSRKLMEDFKFPLCFIEQLYRDTAMIIKTGNPVILRVMVDIVKLCKKVAKSRKAQAKEINLIVKKVKFYMSWCLEKEQTLRSDLPEIQFEALSFKQLVVQNKEMEENPLKAKDSRNPEKKLIEVLDP